MLFTIYKDGAKMTSHCRFTSDLQRMRVRSIDLGRPNLSRIFHPVYTGIVGHIDRFCYLLTYYSLKTTDSSH